MSEKKILKITDRAIEDRENPEFNTLEKAHNYLGDLKKKLVDKASAEEFPITTSMPEDRIKFLNYCISLLTGTGWENHRALLRLKIKGYSNRQLAYVFKVPEKVIEALEKDAIVRVKDKIAATTATGIPLVGGM